MKKLLLAGALLCSAGLASALLLPVGNATVLTTREATQENLLPVSGFDDADFSQTFTSGVFNQWVTHSASSETNTQRPCNHLARRTILPSYAALSLSSKML